MKLVAFLKEVCHVREEVKEEWLIKNSTPQSKVRPHIKITSKAPEKKQEDKQQVVILTQMTLPLQILAHLVP